MKFKIGDRVVIKNNYDEKGFIVNISLDDIWVQLDPEAEDFFAIDSPQCYWESEIDFIVDPNSIIKEIL